MPIYTDSDGSLLLTDTDWTQFKHTPHSTAGRDVHAAIRLQGAKLDAEIARVRVTLISLQEMRSSVLTMLASFDVVPQLIDCSCGEHISLPANSSGFYATKGFRTRLLQYQEANYQCCDFRPADQIADDLLPNARYEALKKLVDRHNRHTTY